MLASSTPHAGGLELFASICVAGHMRDAMPPELAGTGVFTNWCGAGRLLPTESLPYGSCARLDYVLVPQDSEVTWWHVPSVLDHCSDTHSPVLATIRYSHPKGSGARRCAARDNAASDPDRAFQYLGSLSGADLRRQMKDCSARWMRLVHEIDGITERPSQAEVDRLWTEGVLRPATELGERARKASASRPSTALSSRRTGGQGSRSRNLCPEPSEGRDSSALHMARLFTAPSLRFQSYECGTWMAQGSRRRWGSGRPYGVGPSAGGPGREQAVWRGICHLRGSPAYH